MVKAGMKVCLHLPANSRVKAGDQRPEVLKQDSQTLAAVLLRDRKGTASMEDGKQEGLGRS
jgi:hypothetical protein